MPEPIKNSRTIPIFPKLVASDADLTPEFLVSLRRQYKIPATWLWKEANLQFANCGSRFSKGDRNALSPIQKSMLYLVLNSLHSRSDVPQSQKTAERRIKRSPAPVTPKSAGAGNDVYSVLRSMVRAFPDAPLEKIIEMTETYLN